MVFFLFLGLAKLQFVEGSVRRYRRKKAQSVFTLKQKMRIGDLKALLQAQVSQ